MRDESRLPFAVVIDPINRCSYALCPLSLCLYSTTVGKPTSFRVESREFKRLKWDVLRERNSNTESDLEFG